MVARSTLRSRSCMRAITTQCDEGARFARAGRFTLQYFATPSFSEVYEASGRWVADTYPISVPFRLQSIAIKWNRSERDIIRSFLCPILIRARTPQHFTMMPRPPYDKNVMAKIGGQFGDSKDPASDC